MSVPEPFPLGPLAESSPNTLPQREASANVAVSTLKRRASSSSDSLLDETARKRMREDQVEPVCEAGEQQCEEQYRKGDSESLRLAEELAQELHCGCCSGLVYRPVIVSPCQHFFCGSCCVLWIRNGGTNCPACRGISLTVNPFRVLQAVVDTLVRNAPHLARPEQERELADELYKPGRSLRIPPPREPSPEPLYQSSDFARPCPHCLSDNQYGWQCPQPIQDPNINLGQAWNLDDGTPPGHAHCGHCENLTAVGAPSTTKCDFCQVYFCGISVQGRCVATPLSAQLPNGMTEVENLIQSTEIYECFDGNNIEVEIMLDYLTSQRLTPIHIYREVVNHVKTEPRSFAPLVELDLFDVHNVSGSAENNLEGPYEFICKMCAAEVLMWGIRDWWRRERAKGFLEESVMSRSDCPDGPGCYRQQDQAHAREFNHIFHPPPGISTTTPQGNTITNTTQPSDTTTSESPSAQVENFVMPGSLPEGLLQTEASGVNNSNSGV